MKSDEDFEAILSGGHPNSLGRTLEVVEIILSDASQLPRLLDCYRSSDEVVRLRTSSVLKRITQQHPQWLQPYIDHLLTEIATIDQASTRWTLATVFHLLEALLTPQQKRRATEIMKANLSEQSDWIVLNRTMETLGTWAQSDTALEKWLLPQLLRLEGDKRGSVSKKAAKMKALLIA